MPEELACDSTARASRSYRTSLETLNSGCMQDHISWTSLLDKQSHFQTISAMIFLTDIEIDELDFTGINSDCMF